MNLTWSKDAFTGDVVFSGVITGRDIRNLKLDNFERAMLESKQESAADFLLDAELLFRRHQEQTSAGAKP